MRFWTYYANSMSTLTTAPRSQADEHFNFGMLTLRMPPSGPPAADAPITVIVSGVGRSGTSMTAAVISALGIPMGRTQNEAVFEDKEFVGALLYFDWGLLRALINKRNEEADRWGLKFPSLQNHLFPDQLERFRNPYLIVVTRDPVATASRATISDPEGGTEAEAFYNVSEQAYDMARFVQKAKVPTLLLSYEKFVAFPEKTIDGIARFCGLRVEPGARAKALLAVSPNNPDYIKLFHHDHRGHFNGIQLSHAFGWCALKSSDEPVTVELVADGRVVATAQADAFRQDLKDAGIGSGHHSFNISIAGLGLDEEAILRVQVEGGGFVLQGSDETLVKLRKGRP